MPSRPTILFVPGLRDHVTDHWQTLLRERIPHSRCVPRRKGDKLSCAGWVADLDQALSHMAGPVVLCAHSAGVAMVVHWARKHSRPIHGALLVTPPDFDTPLPDGYPTRETLQDNGWLPMPLEPLPFPTVVAASVNDPLARFERVQAMAWAWGACRLVNIGAVGHLNPASGYGDWPQGMTLLEELLRNGPRPGEGRLG
jgi:predicted alpha/beta hydrolase family esterase